MKTLLFFFLTFLITPSTEFLFAQEIIQAHIDSLSWDLSNFSSWEKGEVSFGSARLPHFFYQDSSKIIEPTSTKIFSTPLIWHEGFFKISSDFGRYEFKLDQQTWHNLPPQFELTAGQVNFNFEDKAASAELSANKISARIGLSHWSLAPVQVVSTYAKKMGPSWEERASLFLDSLQVNPHQMISQLQGLIPTKESFLTLSALLGKTDLRPNDLLVDIPEFKLGMDNKKFSLLIDNAELFCARSHFQSPWPVKDYLMECLNSAVVENGADKTKSDFHLNLNLNLNLERSHSEFDGKFHKVKTLGNKAIIEAHQFVWKKEGPQEEDQLLVGLQNVNFECLKSPWDASNWGFSWVDCVNFNSLKQHTDNGPISLNVNNNKLHIHAKIKSLNTKAKSFSFIGNSFYLNSTALKLNLSETKDKKQSLKLGCLKHEINKDFDAKSILVDCLKSSQVQIPRIRIQLKDKDFELRAQSEAMSIDQETLFFSGPFISMFFKDIEAQFRNLSLYCDKLPFNLDSPYKDIFMGCLNKSWSDITDIHVCHKKENMPCNRRTYILQSDDDFELDLKTKKIEIDPENIELQGDRLAYFSKKATLSLDGLNLKCKNDHLLELVNEQVNNSDLARMAHNNVLPKKTTLDHILKGCFDTSTVDIKGLSLRYQKFSANVNIRTVHLDKGRIVLDLPTASYRMNGEQTDLKNIDFFCSLDAQIQDVTGLMWKNLLGNCLKRTQLHLGSLKAKSDSLIDFGIVETKNVSLTINRNQFSLGVTAVLGPIPKEIDMEVNGKINFTEKRERIHLQIHSATIVGSILPLRIPIKKLLMPFILGHIFDDKYLEQDGDDDYYIILPKNDDEKNQK